MEALLYFARWTGLIGLMKRLSHDVQIIGQPHGHLQTRNGPNKDDNLELRQKPPRRRV